MECPPKWSIFESAGATCNYYKILKLVHDDRVLGQISGSIVMEPRGGEYIKAPIGGASAKEDKKDTLTEIINKINETFGTDFRNQDKVLEQIRDQFLENPHMKNLAINNTEEIFAAKFNKEFDDLAAVQCMENNKFFTMIMENESIKKMICDNMRSDIYRTFRKGLV
ncbi:MAG TPA: hypothetical protein O0W90_02745 [Methanocorpusculum sp.]|nr:hypothetical protein [Methanocorpusculum sp.]